MKMPDREKVIKAYEDFVNGYECFCTSDDYEYEMHKAVLSLLKEQEAEWLEVDDKHDAYDCSNCGAMASRKCLYCPGCGAKMKNGTRAMEGR